MSTAASDYGKGISQEPAYDAFAVTIGTAFAKTARALYVGVSGDVSLITAQGTTVTFKSVPVGVLPVMATKVNTSGTTATDIVGLV